MIITIRNFIDKKYIGTIYIRILIYVVLMNILFGLLTSDFYNQKVFYEKVQTVEGIFDTVDIISNGIRVTDIEYYLIPFSNLAIEQIDVDDMPPIGISYNLAKTQGIKLGDIITLCLNGEWIDCRVSSLLIPKITGIMTDEISIVKGYVACENIDDMKKSQVCDPTSELDILYKKIFFGLQRGDNYIWIIYYAIQILFFMALGYVQKKERCKEYKTIQLLGMPDCLVRCVDFAVNLIYYFIPILIGCSTSILILVFILNKYLYTTYVVLNIFMWVITFGIGCNSGSFLGGVKN